MDPEGDKPSGGGGGSAGKRPDSIPEVPPNVITAVLALLPPNEVALSARRTCKAAAQHFAAEHHRTAAIDQPLPTHAASEPLEEVQAAFCGLTFNSKLYTLSIAAGSGTQANLEVAWRLLQPCLFPELLATDFYLQQLRQDSNADIEDAGTAAAKSGHISALSWLLDRCPGLLNRTDTLKAAAQHCPLAQLQEAWGLLYGANSSSQLEDAVLNAAALSATLDAVPKMEWLLQESGCIPTAATAAAAAHSGDFTRLRWLRECGCPMDSCRVLEAVLESADLSVAEWLVDEAGCPLLDPNSADARLVVPAAAAASGSVAKLQWLQARGVAMLPEPPGHLRPMAAAVASGHLDAVRFLHQDLRDQPLSPRLVLHSGSPEIASYLLRAGCPVDNRAWMEVGPTGNMTMVRWLLQEAHLPAVASVAQLIDTWPETTGPRVHNQLLLEAVRLMAPPGSSAEEMASAVEVAARRSDVDLLRYLHEELGCGLGPRVLAQAARGGCEAVIAWLVEQACAAGGEEELLANCYLEAAQRGNLAALECLRRLGVPWREELLHKAVESWDTVAPYTRGVPLPAVKWMWGQGARITAQDVASLAVEERLGKGGMEVVEWLEGQLAAT